MDAINEYLKRTKEVHILSGGERFQKVRPRMKCADGYEVSVQAGFYLYSEPRTDEAGEYTKVELGFPNMVDPELEEYAEEWDDPLGTVYGWVPVELVNKLIEKHGGIVN